MPKTSQGRPANPDMRVVDNVFAAQRDTEEVVNERSNSMLITVARRPQRGPSWSPPTLISPMSKTARRCP